MNYVERIIQSQDWITVLFVSCFVLLALLSVFYKKRLEDFLKLPISNTYFIGKGKSEEVKHPFNLILFCIQIISISLFIYLFFLEQENYSKGLFLQISIGVFVFIAVKFIIEKMIGTIFSMEDLINNYVFQKFSYKNFISILLFILNLFFYYTFLPSKNLLLAICGLLILIHIILITYSFKNHRTLLFSNFFYFLLYLCTLEISPYLIVYKALN